MAIQRPSLDRADDVDRAVLTLEQRPLVPWALLAHLSAFVLMPLSIATGLSAFGVPWFVFAVLFFIGGLVWRRRATFTVTPLELHVDAWTGLLPRPTRMVVPLNEVELFHSQAAAVNGRQTFKLFVTDAHGKRHKVSSLACTHAELEELATTVQARVAHAKERLGAGVDEVPEALQQVQAAGLTEKY